MRNLNDIEAKSILLLNELELYIKRSSGTVDTSVVLAASNLRKAFDAEDTALGKDLEALLQRTRQNSTIIF